VVIKSSDDAVREVITDAFGRFLVSGLTLGRYHVIAELHGFRPASGTITLSEATPRAHLAWSLEPGCLEDVRVKMGPREAAPIAEAIVHVRIASVDGPLVWSTRADCEGIIVESYTATSLKRVKGKASDEGALRLLMHRDDTRLKSGMEYVMLLWAGGITDDSLVLPVESGRIVTSVPLGGMQVEQAMKTLAQWASAMRP
jgi:hypothetical protein